MLRKKRYTPPKTPRAQRIATLSPKARTAARERELKKELNKFFCVDRSLSPYDWLTTRDIYDTLTKYSSILEELYPNTPQRQIETYLHTRPSRIGAVSLPCICPSGMMHSLRRRYPW